MGCLDFWLASGQRSASQEIQILRWGPGSCMPHPQVSDTPWTPSETRHMPSLVPPWHLLWAPPLPLCQGGQRLICKQRASAGTEAPLGSVPGCQAPGPWLSSAWVRGHIPDSDLPRKGQCSPILGVSTQRPGLDGQHHAGGRDPGGHSPPGAWAGTFSSPWPVVREGVAQVQPVGVEQGVGVAPSSIPNTPVGVKQREGAIRGSDAWWSANLARAPNQPWTDVTMGSPCPFLGFISPHFLVTKACPGLWGLPAPMCHLAGPGPGHGSRMAAGR